MRKSKRMVTWVVYRMGGTGQPVGPCCVCEQGEWDEMELARPGYHTLVRSGINSEPEAEKLARESPGGTAPGRVSLKFRP